MPTQGLQGQSAGPRGQGDPPGGSGCWRACLRGEGPVWVVSGQGADGASWSPGCRWWGWGGRCPVGANARVYLTRGPAWPWGSPAAPAHPGSEAVSARHCGPRWQGPQWAAAAPRLPQPRAAAPAGAGLSYGQDHNQREEKPKVTSLGKNIGVGSHSLLQGIFPNQGLNPSLLHCRQILYYLNL